MTWDLEAAEREVGPLGNPWRIRRYEWALHLDGWVRGTRKRGTRYTDRAEAMAAYDAAVAAGHQSALTCTTTLLRPAYRPKRTTTLYRLWSSKGTFYW